MSGACVLCAGTNEIMNNNGANVISKMLKAPRFISQKQLAKQEKKAEAAAAAMAQRVSKLWRKARMVLFVTRVRCVVLRVPERSSKAALQQVHVRIASSRAAPSDVRTRSGPIHEMDSIPVDQRLVELQKAEPAHDITLTFLITLYT